jgi:hypothetical protein
MYGMYGMYGMYSSETILREKSTKSEQENRAFTKCIGLGI